jgi:hypothetical protein
VLLLLLLLLWRRRRPQLLAHWLRPCWRLLLLLLPQALPQQTEA